jgi:hypothetical protein
MRSKDRKPTNPWIPIIISLVALSATLINLYKNYWAPFDPLITVGSPVYQFGTVSGDGADLSSTQNEQFDPKQDRVLASILIPIVFTHEGGKPGVISDVMLRVSRTGKNDKWFFEPRLNVDEQKYLTSFDNQSMVRAVDSGFSPIALAQGDQIKRFIAFQPDNNQNFPSGRLRLDRYTIHVLCRIDNDDSYKEIDSISVEFTSEVLTKLASDGTSKYIPPPESISRSRDKLRGRN